MRKNALLAVLLSALPPLLILLLVRLYGITVPYYDQWELVEDLEKFFRHSLTITDVLVPHNEHRIFFPKLLMLGLAWLTEWDIRYELLANMCLAAFMLLLFRSLVRFSMGERAPLWLAVVLSFLVFSPAQHGNWVWGWQIQIFMSVLGTMAAIWALSRWPGESKGLLIGVAGAAMASYSFGNGNVTWLGGAIVLLLGRRWRELVLWAVAGGLVVALYYHGYEIKAYDSGLLLAFLDSPVDFLLYVLAYVGSSLGFHSILASVAIGVILIILLSIGAIIVARMDCEEAFRVAPWVALSVYVLMSAAITGAARMFVFGVEQALSSRYCTISNLMVVSSLVMTVMAVRSLHDKQDRIYMASRYVAACLGLLLVLAHAATSVVSVRIMTQTKEGFNGAPLSRYYPGAPPSGSYSALTEFSGAEHFYQGAAVLSGLRLTIFAFDGDECAAAERVIPGGLASIDLMNDEHHAEGTVPRVMDISREPVMIVSGWAVDSIGKRPAGKVILLMDEKPVGRAFYGIRRADVARAFGERSYSYSGWEAFLDAGHVSPGVHQVSFHIISEDGRRCYKPGLEIMIELED